MKNNHNNLTPREILLYLLVFGGITFGLSNPALLTPAIFISHYLGKEKISRRDKARVKSSVYYLSSKKYISVTKKKDKIIMSLTNKGREGASMYQIQSQLNVKNKRMSKKTWKGYWYLVMFDIKDTNKIKRDALRRVLQRSGFKQFQKSIWIYPHNCIEEIILVKEFFNINNEECRTVVSNNIGDDENLKKYFNLK